MYRHEGSHLSLSVCQSVYNKTTRSDTIQSQFSLSLSLSLSIFYLLSLADSLSCRENGAALAVARERVCADSTREKRSEFRSFINTAEFRQKCACAVFILSSRARAEV